MNYTRNKDTLIKDLQAHIADLEQQVKAFLAEKNNHSAREDMMKDGKIDLQNISPAMATQIIRAFNETYDKQSTQNIEDLRHREGGDDSRVREYDIRKKQHDELKERFKL